MPTTRDDPPLAFDDRKIIAPPLVKQISEISKRNSEQLVKRNIVGFIQNFKEFGRESDNDIHQLPPNPEQISGSGTNRMRNALKSKINGEYISQR